MKIPEKQNKYEIGEIYKGPEAPLYGPVFIAKIVRAYSDGSVEAQSIDGFGLYSPDQMEDWKKVENIIDLTEWLERVHSPSDQVTQFAKSLVYDILNKQYSLDELLIKNDLKPVPEKDKTQ